MKQSAVGEAERQYRLGVSSLALIELEREAREGKGKLTAAFPYSSPSTISANPFTATSVEAAKDACSKLGASI